MKYFKLLLFMLTTTLKLQAQVLDEFYNRGLSSQALLQFGKAITEDEFNKITEKQETPIIADDLQVVKVFRTLEGWFVFLTDTQIRYYTELEFLKLVNLDGLKDDYAINFVNKTTPIIDLLSVYFDIAPNLLDRSVASFKLIDDAYRKKKFENKETIIEEYIYLPYIAYVGETIIQQTLGKWEVETSDEGYIYPVVIGNDGRKYTDIAYNVGSFYSNYSDKDWFSIAYIYECSVKSTK